MNRTLINSLIAGLMGGTLVACGGDMPPAPQTALLATTTVCYAAWSSTTAYTGGATVSYNGINYTAAYWTQGNNPATSNGPAGSGQPWTVSSSCGATPTPAPTPAGIAVGFDPHGTLSAFRMCHSIKPSRALTVDASIVLAKRSTE